MVKPHVARTPDAVRKGVFGTSHLLRDRAARLARYTGRAVLDVALPPLCLACNKPVGSVGALCPTCWTGLHQITTPVCTRLGTPLPSDLGFDIISPKAIAEPPAFRRARSAVRFEGTGRLLVHRLKYGDRLDLVQAMAGWMKRAGSDLLADADVLVPIPLHRTRLWWRRFNQAGELAKSLSRMSGVPVEHDLLLRERRTQRQVGLSRSQRARNLAGALSVPDSAKARVMGRRILLVDDVLTSGATLNAAARALRRAGASEVDALTFALVVDEV
jgi:ComF family protein